MKSERTLTTSPALFLHGKRDNVCGFFDCPPVRINGANPEFFKLLFFFLSPRKVQEAHSFGLSHAAIKRAIQLGILVEASAQHTKHLDLWEKMNWSRSAFLTFSQIDIPYSEPDAASRALTSLTKYRRQLIKRQLEIKPYPQIRKSSSLAVIMLPKNEDDVRFEKSAEKMFGEKPKMVHLKKRRHKPASFAFDPIVFRRSVRSFSNAPIPLQTFSSILYRSTFNLRIGEETKSKGDPYYLLNSYYSWLTIYVAIQNVESVKRGIYQYWPLDNSLRLTQYGIKNKQIIDCIQGQYWIGGGGFCVFTVVNWERYMWLYRHSRAYLNLLIQIGEYQQELVAASCRHGLGTWVTPAVSESKASALLNLDPIAEECMTFMKVGIPALALSSRK